MLAINTAQAVVPAGVAVTAKASGMIVGGSNVSLTWTAPAAASYKVWLNVPKGSKATNALYRVYPKGNLVGNTLCSPTDATYPCFEIPVNQALNQNKWIQLTSNANTQWTFAKGGYIAINPGNLAASELLGVAAIRFEKITTTLAIGQTYQGGIIFYLDATGQHGLIAAPTDQSTSTQWCNGCYIDSNNSWFGFTEIGGTSTVVGTGQANTNILVASQGAGNYAAKLCDDLILNGYSDWFLPSSEELNLMFTNIGQGATNYGGFAPNYYWSSSEDRKNYAWYKYFYDGFQRSNSKNLFLSVRAVRSF
jgi:hypothetical protein